jgi:hypothetical protein
MIPWTSIMYALTFFTVILVPIYWHYYGLFNFLWLSDIGLFLTVIALWADSTLIMSMAAVGVIAVELIWSIDFFVELIFQKQTLSIASYMFDDKYPWWLRALSLFHLVTPMIWISYLHEHSYDPRALGYFTLLYWCVLIIVYTYTMTKENINWVFVPAKYNLTVISERSWFIILFILFPLLVFVPTHVACKFFFSLSPK